MSLDRFVRFYNEGYWQYELSDGTSFDSATELVQVGLLGMCMCHDAAANLRYIRASGKQLLADLEEALDLEYWVDSEV